MLIQSLKIIKSYTNCGIIAVFMGITLSIIGKYLSIAQKHNRYKKLSIIGRDLISTSDATCGFNGDFSWVDHRCPTLPLLKLTHTLYTGIYRDTERLKSMYVLIQYQPVNLMVPKYVVNYMCELLACLLLSALASDRLPVLELNGRQGRLVTLYTRQCHIHGNNIMYLSST